MGSQVFVIAVVCFAVWGSTQANYWADCGSAYFVTTQKLNLSDCVDEMSICNLTSGSNVTIEILFSTSSETLYELTLEPWRTVNGSTYYIPIKYDDPCEDSGLECPLVPGQHLYRHLFYVDVSWPKEQFILTWKINSGHAYGIVCAAIRAKIQ